MVSDRSVSAYDTFPTNDGLDGVPEIRICIGYKIDGKGAVLDVPPNDAGELARCQPVYTSMPGWLTPTDKISSYKELPVKARRYAETLAKLSGAKLAIVSVGPGREQTIHL